LGQTRIQNGDAEKHMHAAWQGAGGTRAPCKNENIAEPSFSGTSKLRLYSSASTAIIGRNLTLITTRLTLRRLSISPPTQRDED